VSLRIHAAFGVFPPRSFREASPTMPNSDTLPSKNRTVGFMLLFASPFLSAGLFGCWWGTSLWSEYERIKSWVEVPAIIKTTELEDRSTHKTTRLQIFATYEYEYDKQQYFGNRVALRSGRLNHDFFRRESYQELKDHRIQQTPFRCYVNPDAPQESILYRNLPGYPLVQSTILAIMPGTIGVAILTVAVGTFFFSSRRSHRNTASDEGTTRIVVFWATIGAYWSFACLPLDRKIFESISSGGSISAWLAIVVPLIGLLMLARAVFFLFESSPPQALECEPSAAAQLSIATGA